MTETSEKIKVTLTIELSIDKEDAQERSKEFLPSNPDKLMKEQYIQDAAKQLAFESLQEMFDEGDMYEEDFNIQTFPL